MGAGRTRRAVSAMVSSDDHLATNAGLAMLLRGGSAVDAAIAANAVLTVTAPHACGVGGDLFALVHLGTEPPHALVASGRAGSGADPGRLRAEGAVRMPMQGDPRSVTVPGCVDGWSALHTRFGRLELSTVLQPAIRYATDGFPPSAELSHVSRTLSGVDGSEDLVSQIDRRPLPGLVRRPGAARVLRAIVDHGRDGFYAGEFGEALIELTAGELTHSDLARDNADWMAPLSVDAHGVRLWAPPPVSQAYVVLSAWWLLEGLDVPADPDSPLWPHLLAEAIRQSAHDRPEVLHEHSDPRELLSPDRLAPRRDRISPNRASTIGHPTVEGSTTYLCAVDGDGMAVSLIQSNASVFGARLVVPGTGIFIQNRGIGFCLRAGHPAEYGPGRRPPHTLSPYVVTDEAGRLLAVLGTRGADAQPQVVLQVLSRMLMLGHSPAAAVRAPRWLVTGPEQSAFETWDEPDRAVVKVEATAPAAWEEGLRARGHRVVVAEPLDPAFGSAHVIVREDEVLAAAADPRTARSMASGF